MIIIINAVECDLCGLNSIKIEEGDLYSDPVIVPPEEWDCGLLVPEEYRQRTTWNIADACPHCKKNPDWEAYKKRWQETEKIGLDDYTVCDDCRKKLYDYTGLEFEQLTIARLLPIECQVCKKETTNWFTPHGIDNLKEAIREIRKKP